MYICRYKYIYIYVCTTSATHFQDYTYVRIHGGIYIYIYIYVHIDTCMYTYVYLSATPATQFQDSTTTHNHRRNLSSTKSHTSRKPTFVLKKIYKKSAHCSENVFQQYHVLVFWNCTIRSGDEVQFYISVVWKRK